MKHQAGVRWKYFAVGSEEKIVASRQNLVVRGKGRVKVVLEQQSIGRQPGSQSAKSWSVEITSKPKWCRHDKPPSRLP
jgi:hypothetical protein